jgi:flagellar hook assembly protein FlgD
MMTRFSSVATAALFALTLAFTVSGCWDKPDVQPPIDNNAVTSQATTSTQPPPPKQAPKAITQVGTVDAAVDPMVNKPLVITLEAPGAVTAVVHDVKGATVREGLTITPPKAGAKTSSVSWDGKDKDGKPMADGKYTIVVSAKSTGSEPVTPLKVSVLVTAGEPGKITLGALPKLALIPAAGNKQPYEFTLAIPTDATLMATVHDGKDKVVQTLEPTLVSKKSNKYQVSWDGMLATKKPATAGVKYAIVLEGADTSKVVLEPARVNVTVISSAPVIAPITTSGKYTTIVWEAEATKVSGIAKGFVIATMKENATGEVSGNKVLGIPKLEEGDKITDPDHVTYKVNIPAAGTYYLWGRCYWTTGCGNSFYMKVEGFNNSGEWILGGDGTYDLLHWICLSDGGDNANSPRPLALKAGTVTFTLGARESGTRVDQFLLTTDAKKRPADCYTPTASALVQ